MNAMFVPRLSLLVLLVAVVALAGCGDSSDGRSRYAGSCAVCHGVDGLGASTGPPLVHELYQPVLVSDEAFVTAIRVGAPEKHWDFGEMPAIEGLSPEDIDRVIAYVRELQRASGID